MKRVRNPIADRIMAVVFILFLVAAGIFAVVQSTSTPAEIQLVNGTCHMQMSGANITVDKKGPTVSFTVVNSNGRATGLLDLESGMFMMPITAYNTNSKEIDSGSVEYNGLVLARFDKKAKAIHVSNMCK